jgi:uncharacterized protein
MNYSKYNIFSKIRNSGNYLIVNMLSGNADILDHSDAEKIEMIREGKIPDDQEFMTDLAEKGYISEEETEQKEYRKKYLDFIDSREDDEVQIFFVTNYTCNFACSYCYQDQYQNPGNELNKEIIDAFFSYIKKAFAQKKKYVTVFGGEPLLNGKQHRENISYLIEKSVSEGIELCFVTNGYYLEEYLPILKKGKIREIQVTLDGVGEAHEKRRFLRGGGKTFDKTVRGIDACLGSQIVINLRMVIDKENIDQLPTLARFAIEKGWTASSFFKTQIGRNYELHHCQSSSERLFTRISLYENISELIKQYPYIPDFYKPAYSVTRFLSENGELPDPLFDSCPACKTEWAFDYTGSVYPCTATVGKADELLGTFYPEVKMNNEDISVWEVRDVTSIGQCKDCNLQLACGGGCGSIAKNRTGSVCSEDCRPVKELLEIGFSAYF